MSDIDITKYPEGFEAILNALDYLPDDMEVRTQFLMGYIWTCLFEAFL